MAVVKSEFLYVIINMKIYLSGSIYIMLMGSSNKNVTY